MPAGGGSFNEVDEAQVKTHQFEPVHTLILLYELVDGPVFHEFRDDFILPPLAGLRRRTNKWKDIRVVQVFPYDHLLEKCLHVMRVNVSVMPPPHCDQTTDPRNLSLPGVVIALIERQHFYSDFLTGVASDPNCCISTVTNHRFTLVT